MKIKWKKCIWFWTAWCVAFQNHMYCSLPKRASIPSRSPLCWLSSQTRKRRKWGARHMSEAGPLFKRENVQPQHQKCKYPSWYWLKVLVPQLTKLITNFGINRIQEMVSFELSLKKWGKMFFVCCDCVWNKEKIIWRLRIFLYSMLMIDEKHLSLFLYQAQNLPFLLFNLQTWCYGHCWFQQFAGHVSYELCNRPRSPQCLCGSVVEHQNTQSKGMRFDSS